MGQDILPNMVNAACSILTLTFLFAHPELEELSGIYQTPYAAKIISGCERRITGEGSAYMCKSTRSSYGEDQLCSYSLALSNTDR